GVAALAVVRIAAERILLDARGEQGAARVVDQEVEILVRRDLVEVEGGPDALPAEQGDEEDVVVARADLVVGRPEHLGLEVRHPRLGRGVVVLERIVGAGPAAGVAAVARRGGELDRVVVLAGEVGVDAHVVGAGRQAALDVVVRAPVLGGGQQAPVGVEQAQLHVRVGVAGDGDPGLAVAGDGEAVPVLVGLQVAERAHAQVAGGAGGDLLRRGAAVVLLEAVVRAGAAGLAALVERHALAGELAVDRLQLAGGADGAVGALAGGAAGLEAERLPLDADPQAVVGGAAAL